jgi:DivIVA domain-containing protein
MEMSPQRVRNAEFKTVRKGADPDEVRVFLNDVADELERSQNQSTAMEARARAAVARLQEVSGTATAAAPTTAVDASVDEAETISRTLLLAQRTADTTIAEARGQAARIVGAANDEAAATLDSTREMAAQLLDEARNEARRAGETERFSIASEVEALKARRDFLESDVHQLELFLTEQRNRLRDSATSILDITERIPGGLGEARPPLLSASDDDTLSTPDVSPVDDNQVDGNHAGAVDPDAVDASDPSDPSENELKIVADFAASDPVDDSSSESYDPWGEADAEPTRAIPVIDPGPSEGDGDFRFSFDDRT